MYKVVFLQFYDSFNMVADLVIMPMGGIGSSSSIFLICIIFMGVGC